MDTTNAAAGESTARYRPCRHCQIPVEQPKRKGQVKDFCTDRHRAAFRDAQVQAGIRQAQAAIQEARDEIERLSARLDAATQLLERGLRHGTRKPKPTRPTEPSAELMKALASLTALPDKLLDGVRKLNGLPPYNSPANTCWNDAYFHRSLVSQFGQAAVDQATAVLKKSENNP